MRVNNGRNDIVIHVALHSRHLLHANDCLFHGLMGQHGSADAITDGKDVLNGGFEMGIDGNETFVVSFQVFDRQTNLLYEDANFDVNDPTRGWDGTDEGRLVNAGVYLYKLVVRYEDFSQETLTGHTTLIR